MKEAEFLIQDGDSVGMRVDKFLSDEANVCSRSRLKALMHTLLINGCACRPAHRLKAGDVVTVVLKDPPIADIEAEPLDLNILFENDDVIVLNKVQGMTVHPGAGKKSGTLVQGLMYYLKGLRDTFNDPVRPGIIHRLDMDTSGVIIAAKNVDAHEMLSLQFRERKVRKRYIALVKGRPSTSRGTITGNIIRDPKNRKRFTVTPRGGKTAVTKFSTLKNFTGYSLVTLKPVTGRTHQIRVHLASMGTPVLGDSIYGKADTKLTGVTLMLHSLSLSITLPGESEPRLFKAPLPPRFRSFVEKLKTL